VTRVALRGLAGRKLRSLLTALAIVLGVAMVSGTFVLTDTIGKAFDEIFTSSYDQTDAVVSGKHAVEWSASGAATVPAGLVEEIRALPGVETAAGTMMNVASGTDVAKVIDRDGKAIGGTNPTFGFGLDPDAERFSPLALSEGRWATASDEVVLDAGTAERAGFSVGDRIEISTTGPKRPYELVGIARFGEVDSLGDATISVFSVETAQRLYGKVGSFDGISVAAKDGISPEELVTQIRPLLPPAAEVQTGEAQAQQDADEIAEFVSFIRYALLAFGGIALFVGAFVIFNTLSITVAQRTRELATLRTLGASRRQVLRSVVLEAIALGALASVIGLALGVALAQGLQAVFTAVGLDLPTASTVFAPRTVVVSLLVGVGITTLAGVFPAVRATRVPPIAAVREGSTVAPLRRRSAVAGTALLSIGLAAIAFGLFAGAGGAATVIVALVGGGLASFLGVALMASRLVRPLVAVVGQPAHRTGGAAGRLARENALRNPARTAATAAALMIGLALVTTLAVVAEGIRGSARDDVRGQLAGDLVLGSENGWTPLPVAAGEALAKAPGVTRASAVRADRGKVGSSEIDVSGVDTAAITSLYRFEWAEGSDEAIASLGRNGAVVQEGFAEEHDLAIGDTFELTTPAGKQLGLAVRGIYESRSFAMMLGHVVLATAAFDAAFPRATDGYVLASVADGAERAPIEAAVATFPDALLQTVDEFTDARLGFLSGVLNLFYVLLALSVVVSLFGMVNTLVLSVFERTRELGMLRAVGMTRRQARRMIRHESVITALIGAALGLPLGLGFAALVTEALSKYGIGFSFPALTLGIFAAVAVVAGIGAAVLPARRASRLNVLAALQYE
jgi:putative ABC transport system permease protein